MVPQNERGTKGSISSKPQSNNVLNKDTLNTTLMHSHYVNNRVHTNTNPPQNVQFFGAQIGHVQ